MRDYYEANPALLTAIVLLALHGTVLAAQPPATNGVLSSVATNKAQETARLSDSAAPPDLTLGYNKPDVSETYNLGPTGMRGWIYSKAGLTDQSRQIYVAVVEKKSPAAGVMEVGDIILGVDGKPFTNDSRICFGMAIGEAEKEVNKGRLRMLVWRSSERRTVDLKLRVMGAYSDTAPYDCPKSKKILEEGCRYIAGKKEFGRFSIGALALLASGKEEYLPIVKEEAHNVTPSDADILKMPKEEGMRCWGYAYNGIFLSEYYLATGDKSVLPGVRAYAINLAEGQGCYGTWGHGTSDRTADGKLHGPIAPYGALNQAGLACYLSLILAQKCGVEHPELPAAIQRSSQFFGYYVGKGAIPYGEHPPVVTSNNDNGKNALAAIAFSLLGRRREQQFFAKTVTASFWDREWGHTGPFFGYMWGGPGANCGGPAALAAYMRALRWQFDLARRWDGSFAYDPTCGGNGGDYNEFSTTAAFMLTYALPQRRLFVTGRDQVKENWLSSSDIDEAVASGNFDAGTKGIDGLMKALGNWSPVVRNRAARELAAKPDSLVSQLVAIAEGPEAMARIGACEAIGYQKNRTAEAVPALIRLLSHDDRWLRVKAAEALRDLGETARPSVPELLKALARGDELDSMQFAQGALAYTLFYPGGALGAKGLLAGSIEGVDRDLLYPAIRAVARHPDCRVRGCLRSTYALLKFEDVKALAPDIISSIEAIGPNNTMFAKGVQLAGIELLARYHIEEGLRLTMMMVRWSRWGKAAIRPAAVKILKEYGGNASPFLPELKALYEEESANAAKLLQAVKEETARVEKEAKDKGIALKPKTQRELRKEAEIGALAGLFRELIDIIESDKEPVKLVRLLER